MVVRVPRLTAFWLVLYVACGDDVNDGASTQAPPVREGNPVNGDPCDLEGERVCDDEGVLIYACESSQWAMDSCKRRCGAIKGNLCSLGCLITENDEDCLCVPCG